MKHFWLYLYLRVFCVQIQWFCETFISSECFEAVWENINSNLKIFGQALRIQHYTNTSSQTDHEWLCDHSSGPFSCWTYVQLMHLKHTLILLYLLVFQRLVLSNLCMSESYSGHVALIAGAWIWHVKWSLLWTV